MKARGEAAVQDSQLPAQVQLAVAMMDHLNTRMDLGLEMRHIILPNSHPAVMAAETQMMPLMQAKAKRLDKMAEKKEEKHNNEDDDDDEERGKGGGVPKWHKHHKAVWEYLFGDPCSSGHGEWSPLAVEHAPARYLTNNWFL